MVALVLQVIGAVLILLGFVLSQTKALRQDSYRYLLLNLLGSSILAIIACSESQWGFLMLEATWAVFSLWGLARRLSNQLGQRGRSPGRPSG